MRYDEFTGNEHIHRHSAVMLSYVPISDSRSKFSESDHRILGEEIWSQKWGQQDSSTGGRWRWRLKTELDGKKWSVVCAPLGATRLPVEHHNIKNVMMECHPILSRLPKVLSSATAVSNVSASRGDPPILHTQIALCARHRFPLFMISVSTAASKIATCLRKSWSQEL